MAKTWGVAVPITGVVHVLIEGDEPQSAEEALARAVEVMEKEGFHLQGGDKSVELGEFEYHREICSGNVLYAVQNEVDWEET